MVGFASQLDVLEALHGRLQPDWPVDPYEFLIWWQCGYPPSDRACGQGWAALRAQIGIQPERLRQARLPTLTRALRAGGLVPEVRAGRLREVATKVLDEFGGDLAAAVRDKPSQQIRRLLKTFPGIADPGADRILLFGDLQPLAAVPSNATQVAVRMQLGEPRKTYAKDYSEGRAIIETAIPATFAARKRAYLILKHHGQEICKRSRPACGQCPITATCAFFAAGARAG